MDPNENLRRRAVSTDTQNEDVPDLVSSKTYVILVPEIVDNGDDEVDAFGEHLEQEENAEDYERESNKEELLSDNNYEEEEEQEEEEKENLNENNEYVEEIESDVEWEKNMDKYYKEFFQLSHQETLKAESDDQDEAHSIEDFQNLTVRHNASSASGVFEAEAELNLTEPNDQLFSVSPNHPIYECESRALNSWVPSDYSQFPSAPDKYSQRNMFADRYYKFKNELRTFSKPNSFKLRDDLFETPLTSSSAKLIKPPDSFYKRGDNPKTPVWRNPLDMPSTSKCTKINMPLGSYLELEDKSSNAANSGCPLWSTDPVAESSSNIYTKPNFQSDYKIENKPNNSILEWVSGTCAADQYRPFDPQSSELVGTENYIVEDEDEDWKLAMDIYYSQLDRLYCQDVKVESDEDDTTQGACAIVQNVNKDDIPTASYPFLSNADPNLNITRPHEMSPLARNTTPYGSPLKTLRCVSSTELCTSTKKSKPNKPEVEVPVIMDKEVVADREEEIKQGAIKKDTYCCPLRSPSRSQPKDEDRKRSPKARRSLFF